MTAKKALYAALTVATAGTLALLPATGASAAHCNDAGRPGNSDYAGHVRTTNGSGAHDEGDHQGFSSCNDRSANYAG